MQRPSEASPGVEILLESQALLASLIESTDAMIWAVDSQDFSIILFNSAIQDFYRVHHGMEIRVGMSHREFTEPSVTHLWTELYQRALDEGHFSTEYQTVRGGHVLLISLGILRRDGEIFGISVFGKNLTALKAAEENQRRLEASLAHSAKMESLGSLAAGIAHDMNNVLGAIQAVVETLQFKYASDPALMQALGTLQTANSRGRGLLKGLANFSRKELREASRQDLNLLIREETEILRHTTFQKVELALDLEEGLPAVMGDRSALASALMNLCVNALDAMGGAGKLTLRTRSVEGGWLEMSVQDTGEGMPPATLARATEPFFTTKPVGKGTGLGLAMVHATAKAHGGSMEIQSEPGLGTQVILKLPGVPPEPTPPPPMPPPAPAPRFLRILLVDDDEIILASVPGMMENLGHTVTLAKGGLEALRILEGGLEVDLVVMDLNMPGMDGFEALEAIRSIRPALPVLLATGSQDSAQEGPAGRIHGTVCIRKPFSMDEFTAVVRELL